jgi:hypothetical protein
LGYENLTDADLMRQHAKTLENSKETPTPADAMQGHPIGEWGKFGVSKSARSEHPAATRKGPSREVSGQRNLVPLNRMPARGIAMLRAYPSEALAQLPYAESRLGGGDAVVLP